jgi:hypothetical protein
MSLKPILLLSIASMLFLSSCRRGSLEEVASRVPREVDGWRAEEDRTFDRETLFKYIDGGAELYLAYRFRRMVARRYAKAGGEPVALDIYDMETPEDAFGVFTAEREVGEEVKIGGGSEYSDGLLRFWKGRFFVSIFTPEPAPENERFVMELGRFVSRAIRSTGRKPDLLSILPERGLVERTIRYFHRHSILNHFYYLSEENILDLDTETDAVLARYEIEGGRPYLLAVRYPDEERAKTAYERFVKAYMPESREGVVRTEDGLWTAVSLKGKILAIVLDAPTREGGLALLGAIERRS